MAAALAVALLVGVAEGCTSIAVGKLASADGGAIVTHNADCLDCDFRIGKVPAADWPEGSTRPVVKFRAQFPRTVSSDRGTTWMPENLDPWLPQRDTWLSEEWKGDMVLGHILQANHTFSYLEGLYAIVNEKQVAIGESTCGAVFWAGPAGAGCERCTALFDISELSRIALERSSTAREAIQIMGDLAVEHGFYGSMWDPTSMWNAAEAGENLMVVDKEEAWMFHILADDTATSAVWAAQRVPDDHVAVCANFFMITEVDKDSPDFMYSPNLWEVAAKVPGYDPSAGPLNFKTTFGARPGDVPHYPYTTRRMWRVFDVLAPSLGLSPYTDSFFLDYPVTVKAEYPVTARKVTELTRDHYEGTPFDLTQGMAAGPYGDVDRYDMGTSPDGTLTMAEGYMGYFERSISLFRTSYSMVAQVRSSLPDEVGAVAWIAQYKPSASTFVPMYLSAEEVPTPYTCGSLFVYTKQCAYWAFSAVGNWMDKYRKYAHEDVKATQAQLEDPLWEAQDKLEQDAAALVLSGDAAGAAALLTAHSSAAAAAAVSAYHALFDAFVARYHDGYRMLDPEASIVPMEKLSYPKPWLEAVGFFHTLQDDEQKARRAGVENPLDLDATAAGAAGSRAGGEGAAAATPGGGAAGMALWVGAAAVAAVLFVALGVSLERRSAGRRELYTPV